MKVWIQGYGDTGDTQLGCCHLGPGAVIPTRGVHPIQRMVLLSLSIPEGCRGDTKQGLGDE